MAGAPGIQRIITMKSSFSSLLAVLAVLLTISAQNTAAQSFEPVALTDAQRDSIREKLKSIVTTLQTETEAKNSNLTSLFMNAASSKRDAVEFFEECVKRVQFADRGLTESDFRQWKGSRGVEGLLDNDDFAESLQIILRYLAISTEAERTSDRTAVFPVLTQYIDGLASLDELPDFGRGGGGGGNNFAPRLNTPIYDTVFAQRFDLFEDLRKKDRQDEEVRDETGDEKARKQAHWETRPLNVGGMYEKFILPFLHQNSPEKVPTAWAKRIEQEARLATARGEEDEYMFRRERLPKLQWNMLVDQFKAGFEVSSAAKMLEHIETYKDTHGDAGEWVEEMIALIFPQTDSTFEKSAEPPAKPNPLEGVKLGD